MAPEAEATMVETEGWSQTPVTEETEWSCRVNLWGDRKSQVRWGGERDCGQDLFEA